MGKKRRGSTVQLIVDDEGRKAHLYEGALKFRGECANCDALRNQHCGRCRACPGWHEYQCMMGYDAGTFH